MQPTATLGTAEDTGSIPQEFPSGTLVIGIGNNLLGDDGAGIHAIERLRGKTLPDHVELVDGGTQPFCWRSPSPAESISVVTFTQIR